MKQLAYGLCLAALLACNSTAYAQTFTFDDQTATFITPPQASRPGVLTSLVMTNMGVTVTIRRANATAFDIVDNSGNQAGKPAAFGTKSLDPFFAPGNDGFIANFSTIINSARLDFGDYGQDSDTLTLNAYSGLNGTGTLLGTQTVNYGTASFPDFSTVTVAGTGIRSLTWLGTSDTAGFTNSVFYDNLRVTTPTAVPEPGSLALFLGMGITGAGMALRRRLK